MFAKGFNSMQKIVLSVVFLVVMNGYSYEYPKPIDGYFSQKGQDKFLNEQIFRGKKNGFFVEVGAHDGRSFSNSFFFERNLGWSGICIEPNPAIFEQLVKNRHCICERVCISDQMGTMPFVKCSGYILEMYSGLLKNCDPRHLERIDKEIALYGGKKEIISVDCTSFKELFRRHKVSQVDFLSIDIEGGEEAALRSIDFDEVKIDVILVENNFNEDKIKNYLLSRGYRYINRVGKDDIYRLEKEEAYV